MILSDITLKEKIASGDLVFEPIDASALQPASIDFRLGDHFLIVENDEMEIITLDTKIKYKEVRSETIIIQPNSFLLGTTQEYLKLPNDITAFVEGRSSVGRMGLSIQNAGWVDPGFEGRITLQLFNASSVPIKLQAGRRVGQLVFCQMDKKAENPYNGKYQGQKLTGGSRVYKDTDKIHVPLDTKES